MAEHRHYPPAGESLVKHVTGLSAECPCKPTRSVVTKPQARGRGGRHQGYAVTRIDIRHNPMPEEG